MISLSVLRSFFMVIAAVNVASFCVMMEAGKYPVQQKTKPYHKADKCPVKLALNLSKNTIAVGRLCLNEKYEEMVFFVCDKNGVIASKRQLAQRLAKTKLVVRPFRMPEEDQLCTLIDRVIKENRGGYIFCNPGFGYYRFISLDDNDQVVCQEAVQSPDSAILGALYTVQTGTDAQTLKELFALVNGL